MKKFIVVFIIALASITSFSRQFVNTICSDNTVSLYSEAVSGPGNWDMSTYVVSPQKKIDSDFYDLLDMRFQTKDFDIVCDDNNYIVLDCVFNQSGNSSLNHYNCYYLYPWPEIGITTPGWYNDGDELITDSSDYILPINYAFEFGLDTGEKELPIWYQDQGELNFSEFSIPVIFDNSILTYTFQYCCNSYQQFVDISTLKIKNSDDTLFIPKNPDQKFYLFVWNNQYRKITIHHDNKTGYVDPESFEWTTIDGITKFYRLAKSSDISIAKEHDIKPNTYFIKPNQWFNFRYEGLPTKLDAKLVVEE